MKRFYSHIEPNKLIFSLLRLKDITNYREDLSPDSEYLQVSGRKLAKGVSVAPHRHIPIERKTDITQEAWVVLEGSVRGTFYDLDNTILYETNINAGDCVVLYRGGHSLEVKDEDTLFYEFKTGPYYGVEADKETII